MSISSIGSSTKTNRTTTVQEAQPTNTQETQPAAQQEAKLPAAQDIIDGARERMQGIGDAIRDRIDGLAPGEPQAGIWTKCGRGKCQAQAPVRGLGRDLA